MARQEETAPVILDLNMGLAFFDSQADVDLMGGGVLTDVGERFLHNAQDLDLHYGSEIFVPPRWRNGQINGHSALLPESLDVLGQ